MKENENSLEKAVKALKNGQVPPGPSKELTNSTLEKLSQISRLSNEENFNRQIVFSKRIRLINNLFRIAAVVILLIAIGYTTGRLSAPKPLDMEQIQSALEPVIREKLLDETVKYMQLGLASSYVQLREELTEQYQQDLRQAALEILTTSGTITNQLLQDLIYSIETAQAQDRQWFAAGLEQIESNRLEDKDRLGNALVNFAVQTEDKLQRTRQDMVRLIVNTQQSSPNLNESFTPEPNKELYNAIE